MVHPQHGLAPSLRRSGCDRHAHSFNPFLAYALCSRQAVGDVCFGSVMGPSSQRANEVSWAELIQGFVDAGNTSSSLPCRSASFVLKSAVLLPSCPQCRIAMFLAGFPNSVPVHTVNRQCSSGACLEGCLGAGRVCA